MGKSLYATVSEIRLNFFAPNKKKNPGVIFRIHTYGLISSTDTKFDFKLSRKFFEKYVTEIPEGSWGFLIGRNIERDDEMRKEFLDEISANLYPKSSAHVVFSELRCDRMIEFMNEIGDQGWDTSGQLPSIGGGPTYLTMMRKRIS